MIVVLAGAGFFAGSDLARLANIALAGLRVPDNFKAALGDRLPLEPDPDP
ncbi:hypothetical protein OG332_42425 [Streptomyces sp. NBC_01233]|nr:hypothetical protein OG332_42425 [Streptomyces sp. NBC_01233]